MVVPTSTLLLCGIVNFFIIMYGEGVCCCLHVKYIVFKDFNIINAHWAIKSQVHVITSIN